MRFNWGTGIVIAAALFVLFILNLVYKCTQHPVDLVTEKYYEKELKYQEQIDRQQNALDLADKLKVIAEAGAVRIRYPSVPDASRMTGEVRFFRPDDSRLDFNLPVRADASFEQHIATGTVKQGWWNVQVQWNYDGTPYYQEEKVLIN